MCSQHSVVVSLHRSLLLEKAASSFISRRDCYPFTFYVFWMLYSGSEWGEESESFYFFFVQPLPRKAATVVQKGEYWNFVCDAQEGSCHKLGYAPPKTPFEKGYSLLYVVGSCIIMSALFCFISDTAKVTHGIKSFGGSCAIEWSWC